MGAYQGKEITVGESVIPGAFVDFIVEQNCESISQELSGVIELTTISGAGMQNVHKLLDGFRERWTLDRRMSKDDLSAAAEWVNGFEEKYGEVSRFLFEE